MDRLYWLAIFSIIIGTLIMIFVFLYVLLWYMARRHTNKLNAKEKDSTNGEE